MPRWRCVFFLFLSFFFFFGEFVMFRNPEGRQNLGAPCLHVVQYVIWPKNLNSIGRWMLCVGRQFGPEKVSVLSIRPPSQH